MASRIFHLIFPITPIKLFYLIQPTSILTVLTAAPHSLSVLIGGGGGWGVGVVTITPSHTSAPAVIYVLSPTRVTASSATKSCAVPVVLSCQVFGNVPPSPFPVSPVGSRISATIEIPLT